MTTPRKSQAKAGTTAKNRAKTAKARAATVARDKATMTERERRFALYYMSTARGNGSEAARMAGVPHKIAAKEACLMLKQPKVMAYIETERARRQAKFEVSAHDVLVDLVFARDTARAMVETDPKAALKLFLAATEKLGAHITVGAFRQQIGIGNPDGSPFEFNLSGFSTDEKRAFLDYLRRAVPSLGDDREANSTD